MSHPCDWQIDKWALGPFRQGQLVLRRSDGRPCRLLEMNSLAGAYRTDDGRWVDESDLEDPLLEGRKRDVRRATADAERRAAVARGDFAAAFPSICEGRPPELPPLRGRQRLRLPGRRLTWTLIGIELALAACAAVTLTL